MGRITKLAILMIAGAVMAFPQQPKYNRGVGVYPGNPDEDFAPPMVEDSKTYRNLALLRPAYQSSSYDYNLTAQLVTDGIKDTKMPRWLATTLSTSGLVNKIEREFLVDNNVNSNVPLNGPEGWMQFEMAGGESPFEIDKIGLQARIRSKSAPSFNDKTVSSTVLVWPPLRNSATPRVGTASAAASPRRDDEIRLFSRKMPSP